MARIVRKSRMQRIRADTGQIQMSPANSVRTLVTRNTVLQILGAGGSVQMACDEAGIARSSFYLWKREDEAFRKATEDAIEGGTDLMEDEAFRRGVKGWLEPIYFQGDRVGYKRVYDGQMLRADLARRRKSWRTTNTEISGPDGRELMPVKTLTREELAEELRKRGLPDVIETSFKVINP